jgi:hypothetical protein
MACCLPEFTMELEQIDEVDDLKFSLNSKWNNISGTTADGNRSEQK